MHGEPKAKLFNSQKNYYTNQNGDDEMEDILKYIKTQIQEKTKKWGKVDMLLITSAALNELRKQTKMDMYSINSCVYGKDHTSIFGLNFVEVKPHMKVCWGPEDIFVSLEKFT